jgi:hypothetical protein
MRDSRPPEIAPDVGRLELVEVWPTSHNIEICQKGVDGRSWNTDDLKARVANATWPAAALAPQAGVGW